MYGSKPAFAVGVYPDHAERDGRRCTFYLGTTDVTPRALNSVNDLVSPDNGMSARRKKRLPTKSLGPNYRRDDVVDRRRFLDVNADIVNELFDGLMVTRRRFCGGQPDGVAYDRGPDHPQTRQDVVVADTAIGVELAESPSFVVLDLAGGVTVKGYVRTAAIKGSCVLCCRIGAPLGNVPLSLCSSSSYLSVLRVKSSFIGVTCGGGSGEKLRRT